MHSRKSSGLPTGFSAVFLRAICLCVLAGILIAGLWPFHAPKNQVTWLQNGGLHFGEYGSIVSASAFKPADSTESSTCNCSLEIWLQPDRVNNSGTILAFYRPDTRMVPFRLRQSLGDLVLVRKKEDRYDGGAKLYVDNIFSRQEPVFVTISSGEAGTAIYANGALIRTAPNFKFSRQNFTGRMIIGNSPKTTDNWFGQLKGLALYERTLSPEEVSRSYESWMRKQSNAVSADGAIAVYRVNEGSGTVVHNQISSKADLLIPERFFVLHPWFLEPFWDEFDSGWSYWKYVCINIAGFVPLGFFFCAFFSSLRKFKSAASATIGLGFAVSLTIEVLQAFLPTRNSGTTDLITNTVGTAIGVMSYMCTAVQVAITKVSTYLSLRLPSPVETQLEKMSTVN